MAGLVDERAKQLAPQMFAGGMFKEVTNGSRKPYVIPTIYSLNNRQNSHAYTWSSSSPWTSFYSYANSNNDRQHMFWMALAGWQGQNSLGYQNWEPNSFRQMQFALNNVVRVEGMHLTNENDTSYSPVGTRIMFIRNNHPTDTKTVSVWMNMSSRYASGHDGATGFAVIPNTNRYSSATSTSFTSFFQYQGSTSNTNQSGSFSLPAQTTAAVINHNAIQYWTGNTGYRWYHSNGFYNLDSTFSDPWIQPDLRMTWTAWTMNDYEQTSVSSNVCHRVWNRTAELYGDR